MKISFNCTYWGCDNENPDSFIDRVIDAGYHGAEMFLADDGEFTRQFLHKLEKVRQTNHEFNFVALQTLFPAKESVETYIKRLENNLEMIALFEPDFINSHTGKDYYSFDDNCRIIETCINFSVKKGIRILHETHRSRFSFHAASLLPYLQKFPELELVGDFSHFTVVSESLLEDQQEILERIIPHVAHIHARVGYEEGPQVNDPSAPEWDKHFAVFTSWWERIIAHQKSIDRKQIAITPEFGPKPYMPAMPYTEAPLCNQWNANVYVMNRLKEKWGI